MSSKDCINYLIEWTTANYDHIPKRDWSFVGEKRMKVLEQGHTRSSNWKRRAIKKHEDTTYRVFECSQTLFDLSTMFLVTEKSGEFSVIVGTRNEFEKYFNKIRYYWE